MDWVGISMGRSALWLVPPDTKADIESVIASLGNVRYVPGMIDGTSTTLRLYEATVAPLPFYPAFPPGDSATALFSVGEAACD